MKLTENQKLLMLEMIEEDRAIIMGDFKSEEGRSKKKRVWQKIFDTLVAQGAGLKDLDYLRRTTWDNMKRATAKKLEETKGTGAGAGRKLSEVDERVARIIGTMEPHSTGHSIPDIRPAFLSRPKVLVPVQRPQGENDAVIYNLVDDHELPEVSTQTRNPPAESLSAFLGQIDPMFAKINPPTSGGDIIGPKNSSTPYHLQSTPAATATPPPAARQGDDVPPLPGRVAALKVRHLAL